MAGNSDGGDAVEDEGGGRLHAGAAETTGNDAPRHEVSVRNFPHRNSMENTELASESGKPVENTAETANNDSIMTDKPVEDIGSAVREIESASSGRKRLPAHERRSTPPKKLNSAPDPKKFAEETNGMPDKVYNSELRARLEMVAPHERMEYYDALDKQKRIRTIGECSGIIAIFECPGIEPKYGIDKRPCGKKGTLKPNGRTALTQGQKLHGKCQHRIFYCPKPRPPSKNGAPGMGHNRIGCGRSISSHNLWNLAVEKRDEIRQYLENHRLLSQTGFEDPGKINTAEKRSLNRTMIAKGRTPTATKRRNKLRNRMKKLPSTPDLYLSEEEDDHLDTSGDDEQSNALLRQKLQNALAEMEDSEKSPPPQKRYPTSNATRARNAAAAAKKPATESIDVDKPIPAAQKSSKVGPSNSKKAATAQLKVALKSPKGYKPLPTLPGGNIIPHGVSEDENDIPFFDVPEPTIPQPLGGAGGLLSPKNLNEKRKVMANLAVEQSVWDKYPPAQQFGLYKDMKDVITKQAEAIDKLITRDDEKTAELEALRKRDAENTAKMTIMQEQISVITERLTGTVAREPTRTAPPPMEVEDEILDGETEFPQLPPLPTGRQPIPQRQPRPPPLPPGAELPAGVEPNWVQIVARGRKITRNEVGDAHIARIAAVKEKLEKIRAKAARRTAKKRPLREYTVLHFSGKGRIQHWQMKKLIQEAMFVKDRSGPIPLVFVSFIGGSIMEVLVDKKYAAKATATIRTLGHTYLKKGIDPFSRLVRKPTANGPTNVVLTNARKCKERAEIILRTYAGPEVIDHYTRLLEQADEIIRREEAKDMAPAPSNENEENTNTAQNEAEARREASPEKETDANENSEPLAAQATNANASLRKETDSELPANADDTTNEINKVAEPTAPPPPGTEDRMEIETLQPAQDAPPRNSDSEGNVQ